jgi:hypothetical protein
LQYSNYGIERSVVSAEVVRKEIQDSWSKNYIRFEFHIKECLDRIRGELHLRFLELDTLSIKSLPGLCCLMAQ